VAKTYNAMGLPEAVKRPAKVGTTVDFQTNWTYDSLGRTISSFRSEEAVDNNGVPVNSGTATSLYTGLVDTVTDAAKRLTRYTSDELGHVIKSEAKNDNLQFVPTEYAYGHFGVLTSITRRDGTGAPANARVASIGYDDLGRQTTLSDPDTGTRTRSYNALGDLIEEKDAALAKTTYTVDPLG